MSARADIPKGRAQNSWISDDGIEHGDCELLVGGSRVACTAHPETCQLDPKWLGVCPRSAHTKDNFAVEGNARHQLANTTAPGRQGQAWTS